MIYERKDLVELIYLYIRKYEEVFENEEFNFSSNYMATIKDNWLSVEKNVNSIKNYYGKNVNNRALGEPHLVHADRNGNNKIYVLTWSDIFDEFSLRHDYLMQQKAEKVRSIECR